MPRGIPNVIWFAVQSIKHLLVIESCHLAPLCVHFWWFFIYKYRSVTKVKVSLLRAIIIGTYSAQRTPEELFIVSVLKLWKSLSLNGQQRETEIFHLCEWAGRREKACLCVSLPVVILKSAYACHLHFCALFLVLLTVSICNFFTYHLLPRTVHNPFK